MTSLSIAQELQRYLRAHPKHIPPAQLLDALRTAEDILPAVPDGWQLVPKEPTEAMMFDAHKALAAVIQELSDEDRAKAKGRNGGIRIPASIKMKVRYRAMLAAAPSPEEPTR